MQHRWWNKPDIPMSDKIRRHGPSDPDREKIGRMQKIRRRLWPKIKNAPADDLVRWCRVLDIDPAVYGDYALKRYLDAYPEAVAEHRLYRGKIYYIDHDVEWEKYGSRSYSRIVNRRVMVMTRTGNRLVRYLDPGEKKESALNAVIPGRKRRKAIAAEKARRAALREKRAEERRVKPAWKIVEKNGKLRSVYDPDFVYPLRRWIKDTPQPDHAGGIYCYGDKDTAIAAARRNEIFADAWTAGKTLVLCKCKRRGKEIRYSLDKIASEYLLIEKVVGTINQK